MREPETVKLLADLGTADNTRYHPPMLPLDSATIRPKRRKQTLTAPGEDLSKVRPPPE
jgi:hypothetical protein